jgi:hypothetical protein
MGRGWPFFSYQSREPSFPFANTLVFLPPVPPWLKVNMSPTLYVQAPTDRGTEEKPESGPRCTAQILRTTLQYADTHSYAHSLLHWQQALNAEGAVRPVVALSSQCRPPPPQIWSKKPEHKSCWEERYESCFTGITEHKWVPPFSSFLPWT